jgi:hypothetical protein
MYQLLDCTDVVNQLGDNVHAVKRNTETSIEASMEDGPEKF